MSYTPIGKHPHNKVNRLPNRGKYDAETVYKIIDSSLVAHVTFKLPSDGESEDDDWPVIIPMIFGRKDDKIYLHGHMSSRLLNALSDTSVKCCVSFTTVQGLVVALNPFHNSMNYASAVLFGYPDLVKGEEKVEALTLITNEPFKNLAKAAEGGEFPRGDRWGKSVLPSQSEIDNTRVIVLQIDTASAKVRTGDPGDDKKDKDESNKYWTGVIIKEEHWTAVKPSPYCPKDVSIPDYIESMIQK